MVSKQVTDDHPLCTQKVSVFVNDKLIGLVKRMELNLVFSANSSLVSAKWTESDGRLRVGFVHDIQSFSDKCLNVFLRTEEDKEDA